MMTSSSDEFRSSGREPAIDIDHLRVIRGKRTALHDFSVRVTRGSITGLLGPSGCGKTTLIRCIVGTQLIASGTVRVLGLPAGSAPLRHRVGYLPQDPTIYNDLRIVDNVRYFAALYGFDGHAADSAIDRVGLSDHSTAYCGNLSGGWRVHWSAGPSYWFSTSRPWVWTRCCARICGSSSPTWPAGEPPCWFPVT
jgi:ABC-2 type transport system ATP-binding protein